MKFAGTMLVVNDMERSKEFYSKVMKFHVESDYGANISFIGGISIQSKESWLQFIGRKEQEIAFGGNDKELYFEEENLDEFLEHLTAFEDITYVHPLKTHNWGQRAVRFYDPDRHIIEVGESLKIVCKRFLDQGMTVEEVHEKTLINVSFIRECKS